MKKKFCLKKIFISLSVISILIISLFIFLYKFLNQNYSEQRYEVDGNLLEVLCNYYSEIDKNPFEYMKYKFQKKRFINSFFEMEFDKRKESYALLYNLKNISTHKDVERFFTGVALKISKVTIFSLYNYDVSNIKFIIVVRRYPFVKNDKVYLLLKTPVWESEPDLIID